MPQWLEDLPDGTSRVLSDSGVERVIPTQTAVSLGYHPTAQQGASPSGPSGADPSAAAPAPTAPAGGNPLGIELPDARAPQTMAQPVQSSSPEASANMEAFGQMLESGADPSQALDAISQEPQQSRQRGEQEQEAVDPSTLITRQMQQQQQPQGPQFATATTSRTSRSRTTTPGVEEDLELMQDATERAQEANAELASARERASTQIAAQRDLATEASEKTAAQIAKRRENLAAETQERMQRLESFQGEFEEAVKDGKRSYWADKSTGQKIAAAIGMMFGAYKQGAYGGPNAAMQIIDRAMQADRQRKRDRVADLNRAIKGEFDLMSAARTVANDEIEHDLLVRDTQLQAVQQQIAKAADIRGTEEAQALAQQANAQLDMARAKTQAQLRDRVQVNKVTTSKRVPVAGTSSGDPSDPSNPVPGWQVNTQVFEQLSNTEKAKARASAGAYESAKGSLQRMREIRKKHGSEAFDTQAATEFKNQGGAIIAALGQMLELGTMQESDVKRVEAMIGGSLSPEFVNDTLRLLSLGNYDAVQNRITGAEKAIDSITLPKLKKLGVSKSGTGAAPSSFRPGVGGGG